MTKKSSKADLLFDKRYSIKEAAKILGCSDRTVRQLRDDGVLLFLMLGGRYWITEDTLYSYIKAQYEEAGVKLP